MIKSKESEPIKVSVKFDNAKTQTYPYEDVEKYNIADAETFRNRSLGIGDSVDCYFQDGNFNQGWYRGTVASISGDHKRCDIFYYDGCFESNVPTDAGKVRLRKKFSTSGEWLAGKSVLLENESGSLSFRSGSVSAVVNELHCRVVFTDGSSESVPKEEAAKGVFRYLMKDCHETRRYTWPVASETMTMAESVKLRRQTRNRLKAIQNYTSPKQSPKKKPPKKTRKSAKALLVSKENGVTRRRGRSAKASY